MKPYVLVGSMASEKALTSSATSFALRHESREVSGAWSHQAFQGLSIRDGCARQGLRFPGTKREQVRYLCLRAKRNDRLKNTPGSRQNTAAADFFQAQPAWYRKGCRVVVISAKEETRLKRLEQPD
jgi:hypothetical protein